MRTIIVSMFVFTACADQNKMDFSFGGGGSAGTGCEENAGGENNTVSTNTITSNSSSTSVSVSSSVSSSNSVSVGSSTSNSSSTNSSVNSSSAASSTSSGCIPLTEDDFANGCGVIDDGCRGTFNLGNCEAPDVCGGTETNVCGFGCVFIEDENDCEMNNQPMGLFRCSAALDRAPFPGCEPRVNETFGFDEWCCP